MAIPRSFSLAICSTIVVAVFMFFIKKSGGFAWNPPFILIIVQDEQLVQAGTFLTTKINK